jgi:hypothetical protein
MKPSEIQVGGRVKINNDVMEGFIKSKKITNRVIRACIILSD